MIPIARFLVSSVLDKVKGVLYSEKVSCNMYITPHQSMAKKDSD